MTAPRVVNLRPDRVSVTIFEIAEHFKNEYWKLPFVGGTLEEQGQKSACDDLQRELNEIRRYPEIRRQREQLRRMIQCYNGSLVVEEGDLKGKAAYDYLVKACKKLRSINWFQEYLG